MEDPPQVLGTGSEAVRCWSYRSEELKVGLGSAVLIIKMRAYKKINLTSANTINIKRIVKSVSPPYSSIQFRILSFIGLLLQCLADRFRILYPNEYQSSISQLLVGVMLTFKSNKPPIVHFCNGKSEDHGPRPTEVFKMPKPRACGCPKTSMFSLYSMFYQGVKFLKFRKSQGNSLTSGGTVVKCLGLAKIIFQSSLP